jgi:hypothetical protein
VRAAALAAGALLVLAGTACNGVPANVACTVGFPLSVSCTLNGETRTANIPPPAAQALGLIDMAGPEGDENGARQVKCHLATRKQRIYCTNLATGKSANFPAPAAGTVAAST